MRPEPPQDTCLDGIVSTFGKLVLCFLALIFLPGLLYQLGSLAPVLALGAVALWHRSRR
jgi:hypothetical protein